MNIEVEVKIGQPVSIIADNEKELSRKIEELREQYPDQELQISRFHVGIITPLSFKSSDD